MEQKERQKIKERQRKVEAKKERKKSTRRERETEKKESQKKGTRKKRRKNRDKDYSGLCYSQPPPPQGRLQKPLIAHLVSVLIVNIITH